jgi:hypothetical protein
MNKNRPLVRTDRLLKILGLAVVSTYLYAGDGTPSIIDVEIRNGLVGTWIVDATVSDGSLHEDEKGKFTLYADGHYTACATQTDFNKKESLFLLWDGNWQVTNSLLTMPTFRTSGFEDDKHPKEFMRCLVVGVTKEKFFYRPAYPNMKTNGPVLYYERQK